MKKLLYFPNFEIKNENWLKYALLYIEEIRPIIPLSGMDSLEPSYLKLINESNLIKPFYPKIDDGAQASLDAIYTVEKIIKNPERFISLFYTRGILDMWRDKSRQTTELYQMKYSYEWKDFCLKNGFASPSTHGIYLHNDLANIYMSILANCISEIYAMSPITDDRKLDRLSVLVRTSESKVIRKIEIRKRILNLILPKNIEDIPIKDIIEFRAKGNYLQQLIAFNQNVDSYFDEENDEKAYSFIEKIQKHNRELVGDMISLISGFAIIGLEAWSICKNDAIDEGALTIPFGLAQIGGSMLSISERWKNTQNTRFTRKYLASFDNFA